MNLLNYWHNNDLNSVEADSFAYDYYTNIQYKLVHLYILFIAVMQKDWSITVDSFQHICIHISSHIIDFLYKNL